MAFVAFFLGILVGGAIASLPARSVDRTNTWYVWYRNGYNDGVECSRCGMHTKVFQSDIWQDNTGNVHIEHNGAEEAIEAWNRRVE